MRGLARASPSSAPRRIPETLTLISLDTQDMPRITDRPSHPRSPCAATYNTHLLLLFSTDTRATRLMFAYRMDKRKIDTLKIKLHR